MFLFLVLPTSPVLMYQSSHYTLVPVSVKNRLIFTRLKKVVAHGFMLIGIAYLEHNMVQILPSWIYQ